MLAALAVLCAPLIAPAQERSGVLVAPLREIRRIKLPGVSGRIDHLAIDLDGQRLFVAALGADEVEIVDMRTGTRIAQLKDLPEAQGVAYVASLHRLFVAAGGSGEVVAFEGDHRVGAVAGLPDADNLRYFAPTGQLVVGFGRGLALIDPATLTIQQRIALPGHPEAFELAEHGVEMYVNVPEVKRIEVVDRRTGKTTAEWPVEPEAANFPMVLDETAHRLYVGTRRPAKLLVYDTTNGHVVIKRPLCSDVDDLFLDRVRSRVLAVCGEGAVDIVSTREPMAAAPAQRVTTSAGARTGLFVPSMNTLFVASPARLLGPAHIIELSAE